MRSLGSPARTVLLVEELLVKKMVDALLQKPCRTRIAERLVYFCLHIDQHPHEGRQIELGHQLVFGAICWRGRRIVSSHRGNAALQKIGGRLVLEAQHEVCVRRPEQANDPADIGAPGIRPPVSPAPACRMSSPLCYPCRAELGG